MKIQTLSWAVIMVFCSIVTNAQETSIADCTDGIDNDGDGLIDLNDDDCSCGDLITSSLIPNPSFEEMSCCPMTEAELNCANDWIQASAATTDYVHTCGVLGNPFLSFEAPLPFPDGEGAIGFRDGKPGSPNFKEYTGACLTGPMTEGVEYRLDFFVGFHDDPGSLIFDMAVFATTDCNSLPFGNGVTDIGCPTNTQDWVQIGEMQVKGENEWKNVVFDFMADQPYSAIVLGPACDVNPNFLMDPYFYFDRLVLAERSMFTVPLNIDGDICTDNLVLSVDEVENANYQWFINGVAIDNATTNQLPIPNDPTSIATFEAMVITATGCSNSVTFNVEIPSYQTDLSETICYGETYNLFGFVLDSTDVYTLTTTASDGCDSMVVLNLVVLDNIEIPLEYDICTGEQIVINSQPFSVGGQYSQMLTSEDGCDSILVINIIELPILASDNNFEICTGQTITINNEGFSTSGDFQQTLTSSNGCDSIVNIAISILQGETNRDYYTICGSNPVTIDGVEYTASGEFAENFTDANGCQGSNIIVIENDPNCENCGSDPLFASSISIQRQTEEFYEVVVLKDGKTILKDIFNAESTSDVLVRYIVVKNQITNNDLIANEFESKMSNNYYKLSNSKFVAKEWFDKNDVNVTKQFRIDVNGEFQMLKKQIDKLKVGNRMSHI